MTELLAPQSSGNREFNVLSYGAKGDGTTNDSAAFNACFSAAATFAATNKGARVVVPPRSYKVNERITIRGNITYDFTGAYLFNGGLYTTPDWTMFNYIAGASYGGESNVTVLGGIFDAKGQNAPVNTGGSGTNQKTVFWIGDGRNYRFEGCTIRNVAGWHGFDVNGIDGLVINNCRFEGFTDNNSPPSRNMSEAIQIQTSPTSNLTKNVKVTNCYMGPSTDGSGLGSFGKLVGSHTDSNGVFYSHIVVSNNTIESPLENGIGFYSLTDSVISNNVITSAGQDAIRLTSGNNSTTNQNSNVVISNNVIDGATLSGISLEAVKRSVVQGNNIYNTGQAGIKLAVPPVTNTQPSPDNTITGNTIIGASQTTNAAYGCIDLSGAANTKNVISNNTFRKFGGSNEANAPIFIRGTGAHSSRINSNNFGTDWSSDYRSNIVNTGGAIYTDNGKFRYTVLGSDVQFSGTTTLGNITGLSVVLDNNAVYEIEVLIAVTCTPLDTTNANTQVPGCKIDWTVPSGATGQKFCIGATNVSADYTSRASTRANIPSGAPTLQTNYTVRGFASEDPQLILERAMVTTGGTGGTVQIRGAQLNSTTVSPTIIKAGSYIRWARLDV